MRPDISEFSYGYALTSEIVQICGATLAGAPIFPSLRDEGTLGYDLNLPIAGDPIFLQFKLCDFIHRVAAKGAKLVGVPHYRMHLRSLKHSQQHNLLLGHERKGFTVLYAAPEFHRPEELNDAYLDGQMVRRSAFFQPTAIGRLDDSDHFVSFKAGASIGYRFSDPIEVERVDFESVVAALCDGKVAERFENLPARESLTMIADEMVSDWSEVVAGLSERIPAQAETPREQFRLENREPLEYLGMVSVMLFNAIALVRLRGRQGA
jgi:hypothetical protein